MLLDKYCLYYVTACGYKTMCGLPLYKPTEITVVTLKEKICVCARCRKKRLRVGSTNYKEELKNSLSFHINGLLDLSNMPYFQSLIHEYIRISVCNYDTTLEQNIKHNTEYDYFDITFDEYFKWLKSFIK